MDEAGEVMGVVGIGTVVDLGAKEEEVFGERRWVSWGSRHFGWEWDIGKGRKGMERGEGYWYGEIGVVGGWGVEGWWWILRSSTYTYANVLNSSTLMLSTQNVNEFVNFRSCRKRILMVKIVKNMKQSKQASEMSTITFNIRTGVFAKQFRTCRGMENVQRKTKRALYGRPANTTIM